VKRGKGGRGASVGRNWPSEKKVKKPRDYLWELSRVKKKKKRLQCGNSKFMPEQILKRRLTKGVKSGKGEKKVRRRQ